MEQHDDVRAEAVLDLSRRIAQHLLDVQGRVNRLIDATQAVGWLPLDGARYTVELIAQRSALGKSAPVVEQFVDNSIVDELEREGFFKKLGARR